MPPPDPFKIIVCRVGKIVQRRISEEQFGWHEPGRCRLTGSSSTHRNDDLPVQTVPAFATWHPRRTCPTLSAPADPDSLRVRTPHSGDNYKLAPPIRTHSPF